MLRLRKVSIFGFKSFAERTQVLFNGTGIAAVVGPNGCGKSNIADSILWVLGEQSAKTLRSSRMADCIFNGTASRPPTNLAEVTLTLVDPEAAAQPVEVIAEPESQPGAEESAEPAPAEGKPAAARKNRLNLRIHPGEIVVTRRLYRDGTSEYYLNGELCRLRDIQELFMGTGLGPQSYAIIEQGRVGQILSSRPGDRRALLEEAAGVTKYKTKRRLAEAKLESARQNLLRVNDILEEITKQLNSLKRQASRARRYQELKGEGTELRRRLLATQLDQISATDQTLAAQLEANGSQLSQLAAALRELEAAQADAQQGQYDQEAALRQEQNQVGQVLVELERAQTRLADTRRLQAETAQRLNELVTRRTTREQETVAVAARVEENRVLLDQLQQENNSTRAALEELTREVEAARQQVVALETDQQQRQQQQAEALNHLTDTRAELAQSGHLAQSGEEQIRRLGAEQELARQELERTAQQEAQLQTSLAQARSERARVQEGVAAAEKALADSQQEFAAEQQRVDELRKSLATALAQQHTLEEFVASRKALTEPVQKLLLGAGGTAQDVEFRAVGVVADFVKFEPDYSPLLEDYLHDELEYVVVETYDAARSGVSLLRSQTAGKATFLVDSFGRFPPKLEPQAAAPSGAGLIAPVSELVHTNGALGSEAKRVLPKLGRTYVVDSAPAAEQLAREHPQFFFLSTDGTCYHGRLVSGGTRNGHGSHSLERELERATRQRSQLEPLAHGAENSLSERDAHRRQLERELEATRQALLGREKILLQLEQQREALEAERNRLESVQARTAQELASWEDKRRTLSEHVVTLTQIVAQAEAGLAQLEDNLKKSSSGLQQARQQAEAEASRLADLRTRQATVEERLASTRLEQTRLEETAARLAAEEREHGELQVTLLAEQERLATELVEREQEIEQRQQDKVAQEERCRQLAAELEELRASLGQREAELRERRAQVEAVREQRHALEVERARQQAERQHAEAAAQSEFGLTAEALCAQVPERLAGEELAQAETRYQEIKQRLENIGPVNMMALEELRECEERYQFLSKQREDIVASIEDTTRAIEEIDAVSRKQFEEAFEVINRNFTETFKILFGGGTATLRLSDAESVAETGVELICQPPGKRLQNVLLLSGGEKALTALALLIAIFRYQPSPFCILDEVDAPLDDTNVGRFTRLVAEMAPHTQFILITHNKKTMEIAPVLYGVTMQNAVSQIVSARFDEPTASAA